MKSRICLFLICGSVLCPDNFVSCQAPTVNTENGQFIGQKVTLQGIEVNEYLGVPYAEPPVGELRFQKPQEIQRPSDQVFEATTQPPACQQFSNVPFPWYDTLPDKSEDCLYLNIWTPADASPENKKAVFYYIYGGGFRYGSIRSEFYSGLPLAALGDIIVVLVNYRVGLFGFLTSGPGTEEAPGNVGLWDMLEGLKWVNKYIDAFGGDTTRITVGGQSAGARATGLLSVSPLAKGLYQRIILQSGTPTYLIEDANNQNLAFSQQIATLVGCASDTVTIDDNADIVVDCLKNVPAANLSEAESLINPQSIILFSPQYEDDILPVNPREAVMNGDFQCADLLIGSNKDEGSLFMTTINPELFGFFGEKSPKINKTVGREMIKEIAGQIFPEIETVQQLYLPWRLPEYNFYRIRSEVYTLIGDVEITCPDLYYAEKCAQQGNNVHYYFWFHQPSGSPWANWMGAVHGAEVEFVFGQPVLHPEKYPRYEVQLSRQMIDTWTSFVKTGNTSDPRWRPFSRRAPNYRTLGCIARNGAQNGPLPRSCDYFRDRFGAE